MSIQIVDCENGGILANGKEIFAAINTTGSVFLKNCGITCNQVADLHKVANDFWLLPSEVKERYSYTPDKQQGQERVGNSGYVAPSASTVRPKTDIRESFQYNYRPVDHLQEGIDSDAPLLIPTLREFYIQCFRASQAILRVLAEGLNLPGEFFTKEHSMADTAATLHALHYTPLPDYIPPGSVRLREHTDYGTITLLFQDDIGGLEVRDRGGQFIPVKPVSDAVLVFTGDLLQRWTADKIRAVRHRVCTPKDKELYQYDRYVIAFLVYPNYETVVKPFDGGSIYKPITPTEHVMTRYKIDE